MDVHLYSIPLSHPVISVRLMLDRKDIPYREHHIVSGFHPPVLRFAGFAPCTVPALEIDGRKIVGSTRISRVLEEIRPRPPLYPGTPAERRRIEEIERWGAEELQEPARRMVRWALVRDRALRRDLLRLNRMPTFGACVVLLGPLARYFAKRSDARDAVVRDDLRRLPGRLRRVEGWIADGTLGGGTPNAADLQIAPSLRLLAAFDDLAAFLGDRPATALGLRYVPSYPIRIGPVLPVDWIPREPADAERPEGGGSA